MKEQQKHCKISWYKSLEIFGRTGYGPASMPEEIAAIISLVGLIVVCSAVFGLSIQNTTSATLLAVFCSTVLWTVFGMLAYEVHISEVMSVIGVVIAFFVSLIGCVLLVNIFDGMKNSFARHVRDEHEVRSSSISHG